MNYSTVMLLLFFVLHFQFGISQGELRIESEYKLAVPDSVVTKLEHYLENQFTTDYLVIQNDSLLINNATETFVDSYFDTNDERLREQNVGLRHRRRYLDKELLSELVQLKLPDSADGVRRMEVKFNVSTKTNLLDELSRHPLLQFLTPKDRDLLSFRLGKYHVAVNAVAESIKLTQKRNRIYFNDKWGSVATITLDKVQEANFPFPGFTELELEINERRYTDASTEDKRYLENINETLKSTIQSHFPSLQIDQTPKYNKLLNLKEHNLLSRISGQYMWAIYFFIIALAVVKFVAI